MSRCAPPAAADPHDEAFDALCSPEVRSVSHRFWTPAAIARGVAALLTDLGARNVLDVGAGAGKLCILGASAAPAIRFVGVEQRWRLVAEARRVARDLGVTNASFIEGDAGDVDWDRFDAVYFYNPFAENIFVEEDRFDSTVVLSNQRFVDDVRRAEAAIGAARMGTVVVTYLRFGGRIPDSYDLLYADHAGRQWLRVWRKERMFAMPDRHWLELSDAVVLADLSGSAPRVIEEGDATWPGDAGQGH